MNNSNFHVLELSAYQTPEIYEDPREDYVAYGEDNNFYQDLIDAFLNSPTTGSIITGVSNQIYGKGFSALDSNRKPDEYAQFIGLFKAKDLKKISLDLKLLGEAAFQITYKGKRVESVSHFNRETLRPEKCDDKGKINAYYYCPKWVDYNQGDPLTRIPVFGSGATNEIYIIRRFIPGMHYMCPPDYISAYNYSKLECEISEYLVNEVQSSFSGTKLVSFVNGIPTQEKQMLIKNEILNKLTGANGEKVIVSFTDSAENKTQIEDISVSDAADVYQYIAEECSRKLLLAHRVTSPLLVGIRDTGNSLGSNAEEIQNAHHLFENVVIKPYQDLIIEAIDEILAVNNISLDLYVKTLTPIEFTDTEEIVTKEQREEETGEKLSSEKPELSDDHENLIIENLEKFGEDIDDDWELVEETKVVDGKEEQMLSKLNLFANTAEAEDKSKLDKGLYKLRYKYDGNPNPQRKFCKTMMSRNKGTKYGLLYRIEDIDKLSALDPNPGLGKNGTNNYDIFKFLGGVNCRHFFKRMIFFRKRNSQGQFLPPSETDNLENDKRVANVPGLKRKGIEGTPPGSRPNKGKA
jgi:hypothetical protein